MTMTLHAAAALAGPVAPDSGLGSWVEAHQEPCRGGRTYRLLVNHRTHQAMELTDAEARICAQLNTGGPGGDITPAAAAFLAELREQGFLAGSPPPATGQRRVTVSLSRLDLRWNGAGRLVRAAHDHGARHLFRPAAVAAQIALAVAGLAALAATVFSRQVFQLRVHPAQIPVVIGLSLAAVAVHEFAHALVVVHHHRRVDAAGVRLHLGTPAFYVESADALLLSRGQRIIQAAAGVWAEWLFTSVVAIWLWRCPLPFAVPLLHRFVILNAATIATNLAPFTGLDGSWLLADAVRAPDLARRSRGAVSRIATALATQQPVPAGDPALAAYAALNGIVAAALLATAGFFWYQLFGDLAATLARAGPAGWLALAVAAVILGRPAATAAAPRLLATAAAARSLHATIVFRLQWRWRIPATRLLAAAIPQLAALSDHQLSTLAGHLTRTRHHSSHRRPAIAASYGIIRAGTATAATAATAAGATLTLTAGATWHPRHQLHHATRGTTLIHISEPALRQILTPEHQTPAHEEANASLHEPHPQTR
jgi:hypothetical protein